MTTAAMDVRRTGQRELGIESLTGIDPSNEIALLEKICIALFTTISGQSVLLKLYDLSCGRIDGYSDYKQEVKVRNSNAKWKQQFREWSSSTSVLSSFLDWVLFNESEALPLDRFDEPLFKLNVRFLIGDDKFLTPLLDTSNLLLDYLYHARPLVDGYLAKLRAKQLRSWIIKYKRVHEFNGVSNWYSNDCDIDKSATKDLFQRYFNVLFDKATVVKEILPGLQTLFYCQYEDPETKEEAESVDDLGGSGKFGLNSKVYSFGLNTDGSIEFPDVLLHAKTRHNFLFHKMKLSEFQSPLLNEQFKTICSFVDPITQPPPNDSHIISIDLLHDLYLGSITPEIIKQLSDYKDIWKIHLSFNLEKIVVAIMKCLNCWDYDTLTSIQRASELDPENYQPRLKQWLPQVTNTQDLELLYMVALLSFYSLHVLHSDKPVQLNPFLSLLFKVWKNLTIVIILGLEIDRLEEERATYNTPTMVRAVIRGASALRALVATMLNGHMEQKQHDFKHEPINLFMSPHGRKLCNGALFTDVRFHAAAMLPLGIDLNQIIEMLSDLQPGDRIDEDVKYMFDYEYHNYNDIYDDIYEDETLDDDELEEIEQRERIKEMRGYYKRCECKFDDDEEEDDENDEEEAEVQFTDTPKEDRLSTEANGNQISANKTKIKAQNNKSNLRESLEVEDKDLASISISNVAMKRKKHSVPKLDHTIGYDDKGNDWRDIPRGSNFYYMDQYIFVSRIHSDVILYLLREATKTKLEPNHGSFVLRSIATCIKLEQEQHILKNMISSTNELEENVLELTGDQLVPTIFSEKLLEKMIYYNNDLTWKILDELFMSYGNRRLILFHLTHLTLSFSLIHYLYELVIGLRGNCTKAYEHEVAKNKQLDILDNLKIGSSDSGVRIPFSRQGPIVLSDIETKMLLQEFFINAALYFSNAMRTDNEKIGGDNDSDLFDPTKNWDESLSENAEDDQSKPNISSHLTGLMKMVCFMVEMLFKDKRFDIVNSEYMFELQTLLMNWINILPEARSIFFQLKAKLMENGKAGKSLNSETDEESFDRYGLLTPVDLENCDLEGEGDSNLQLSNYNKILIKMLPPVDMDESPAITALRSFISKYSLTRPTPLYGRKVVQYSDVIEPLYRTDRETLQREFLAEFGIDFNDVLESQQQEAEEENNDESI